MKINKKEMKKINKIVQIKCNKKNVKIKKNKIMKKYLLHTINLFFNFLCKTISLSFPFSRICFEITSATF